MQTALGTIIDSSLDEFKSNCATLTNGEILGLKNVLTSTYEELRFKKDLIVKGVLDSTLSKDESDKTLKGIYSKLFSIESKVLHLSDLLKSRTKVTD